MTGPEKQQLKDIHDALFKIPAGSKDEPLIADIRRVVTAYKRASWTTRAVIYVIPTLALIGASVRSMREWFTPS